MGRRQFEAVGDLQQLAAGSPFMRKRAEVYMQIGEMSSFAGCCCFGLLALQPSFISPLLHLTLV